MRERPILFSAPMVRAILAGTKTQTRRVVKHRITGPNPPAGIFDWHHPRTDEWLGAHGGGIKFDLTNAARLCPYGQPGDRLWVREAFSGPHCMEAGDDCAAVPPSKWGRSSDIWYWADGDPDQGDWTRPRPSIHMPRWASRILLEIVSVRVERLQEISEADALAEGVASLDGSDGPNYWTVDAGGSVSLNNPTAQGAYSMLWDWINGPRSWDANPWVWVVEFKRVQP